MSFHSIRIGSKLQNVRPCQDRLSSENAMLRAIRFLDPFQTSVRRWPSAAWCAS